MVEKVTKVEKWKTIKVPEDVWRAIKVKSAGKGIKIYEELKETYV